MSQPAAVPKKPRKSSKKPATLSPDEPHGDGLVPSDQAAPVSKPRPRKAKSVAPATAVPAPTPVPASKAKAKGAGKAEPLGRAEPRPAYASGPSHSDFVGLAVLAAVVALAVALFWLTGQRGLGAAGSSLPWLAAA